MCIYTCAVLVRLGYYPSIWSKLFFQEYLQLAVSRFVEFETGCDYLNGFTLPSLLAVGGFSVSLSQCLPPML